MVTNMLSVSLQLPMLFRADNKLSHLPSPDYPRNNGTSVKQNPGPFRSNYKLISNKPGSLTSTLIMGHTIYGPSVSSH